MGERALDMFEAITAVNNSMVPRDALPTGAIEPVIEIQHTETSKVPAPPVDPAKAASPPDGDDLLVAVDPALAPELAATVAHEVRNPLGVLFNSVASLRRLVREDATKTTTRGDAEELLSIVDEETERLNVIIADLLEFARPVAMRPVETGLTAIVRTVTSAVPELP